MLARSWTHVAHVDDDDDDDDDDDEDDDEEEEDDTLAINKNVSLFKSGETVPIGEPRTLLKTASTASWRNGSNMCIPIYFGMMASNLQKNTKKICSLDLSWRPAAHRPFSLSKTPAAALHSRGVPQPFAKRTV